MLTPLQKSDHPARRRAAQVLNELIDVDHNVRASANHPDDIELDAST